MADHRAQVVTGGGSRRRIVYVTTCRSDYGPAYWVVHELFADKRVEPMLIVAGSHLSERHGLTVREIEGDGWPIAERVPFESEEAVSLGRAVIDFAELFARHRPDVVLILGDRLELLAVATAAVLTRTPMAHISGGEVTEGALDEQVRHALTKMAHVHFPGTALSAARVRQMGEEAWRVHQVGDPALDHFQRGTRGTSEELMEALGFLPDRNTLLVTQHAATVTGGPTGEAEELVAALREHSGPIIVTSPAPDPGSARIREVMAAFVADREKTVFVESLGSRRYRGVLALVGAMVGNSSSGLIEAASARLPVVNVGERQQGRERGANVIDVVAERGAIAKAIRRALSEEFRRSLEGMTNPYGDGRAAPRMVEVLATLPPTERLLRKRFVNGPSV
jgi:UDP-hydrolysing UDP-N-acetyl-D-glucosamine 2-epimerase